MDPISIAILCGGQSKRFGGDKCVYRHQGRPLYKIVYQRLMNLSEDIFLQGWEKGAPQGGLKCYPDIVEDECPLAGIYSALHHAKHPKVFVTACDMPFIDSGMLAILSKHLEHELIVPRWVNGWYEPLCAIYSRSLIPKIEGMLTGREYEISSLYPKVEGLKEVVIDPLINSGKIGQNCFHNLNEPLGGRR